MGYLETGLRWLLQFFYDVSGSYGLAIILLTIAIRLILAPLTLSQSKSMEAMKALQPEMNALQQKYKDNPEEYQRRVMELYKEHNVNPLSGCLPMLIQLPFLWALFSVLRNFDFGTGFLWLTSLSEPDPLYILPVLSALTTYTQMIMTSADASQKSMMFIMPIFIGYISISFPAGLVLYWVVSNLFSMGQQYLIARRMSPQEGGKA
ncbi:MAG: membrane protein insertase YidC [Firmicutes bacterium]|nr:membrane protein insertase YidC [Bacillota bacterium]